MEVSKHTCKYFNAHRKRLMTYTEIATTFGNPGGDLGSGIHIHYYNLNDSTSILIRYSDRIMYAGIQATVMQAASRCCIL